MAGLRDQFEHFYTPDERAVATALRAGLVTPDTNVLLSLYRFQSEAREDLFGAFQRIGDRLWIPHQVALEFHRNRLKVIADQESYFKKSRGELESTINEYLAKLKSFSARIALSSSDAEILETKIRKAHAAVIAQVSSAELANEVHLESRDSDEVLGRLEVLFNGRVGGPMESEELITAKAEGRRRVDDNIPPGYMDKGKPDPSGDYILWKQLIREASMRKLPTVFITDDRKEDWYWRERSLTIGARYELRKEMADEAGVSLLIMTSDRFLVHAKNYLDVSVSPATVDQAKELRDIAELERLAAMERDFMSHQSRLTAERDALDDRSLMLLDRIDRMKRALFEGVTEYGTMPPVDLRQQISVLQAEVDDQQRRSGGLAQQITASQAAMRALEEEMNNRDLLGCSRRTPRR